MVSKTFLLFGCILLCHRVLETFASGTLQLDNLRYNDCGRYTCPGDGKFQFLQDTMYQYLYNLTINSTFDQEATTFSELKFEFKVEIRIEDCEGVMRVSRNTEKEGFSTFEENGYDKIYADVRKYPIRFSFYDGSIINVCPDGGESISSLNIKKGILSAFQNKMKRFDIDKFTSEKDINGLCPTSYNLERINGTTLVIRKIKDLANCFERYQLFSVIPTSRYVFQTKFQKWAPLNSTMVCHQTIDHRIPTYIQCHEEHMLKLLPNQTYSSRTFIKQEFTLMAEVPSFGHMFTFLHYPDDITARDDLSFDHTKPKKSEITELEESEALLQQLCDITSEEFQFEAAGTFTKFIHTARHLSYDALEMLLERSSDLCTTARKHVQDSLPFLRSTAAVSLMKDIIINGNISEATANGWLFAMSLFSRPDEEMINSVISLLNEKNATSNILLRITSVIHSYGVWANKDDKETRETITSAITYLEIAINQTLTTTYSRDKIIVLLKSLGNAGVLTKTIGYTLSTCINNFLLPTEVRIAAIEAHRRLPCEYNIENLLEAYANVNFESEVRIAAYLQLMRCPTYGTIKKIKETLENENVNQVGTFVWSHFQNLLKSKLVHRVEIQSILLDYNLQKKFRSDFRKFSRNYETSFYLSDYSIGGVIEANVIFSTKTYIPTYITFNVTVNVFGETVNVLEANIFLEGFERYFQTFFKTKAENFLDKLEQRLSAFRFLRSIPTTIKEKIKSLNYNFVTNFPEPSLSVGFKLFGNEIQFTSYRGEDGINELIHGFDMDNIIREFLNGQEIKYDYSTVFMDMSYVSPTTAGVPLNLDVVGIAITNFDTSILVDISNFYDAQRMSIAGKLKPKFSLNFEGIMGTDLVYEQTQIQMKSKVYTSSEVEGNFNMNGRNDVTMSLNLPLKKYDIFTFESNFFYKNNDVHEDVMLEETSESLSTATCFWPLLDQTLGLKVCSTYYVQNSPTMLQSIFDTFRKPFKFSLFVEKSDPTAKTYIFKYKKTVIKSNESTVSVEFETPHSRIPRSIKMGLYLGAESNNMTIIVHANRSLLEAHGLYKNTPSDKVLKFDLDINRLRQIDLVLELHMKHDKRATIYTPKLYFAITSKPVAELSGTYKWVEKKGTSQCDIDLQFKTNKFDSYITGYIVVLDRSVSSNVHIRYKFEKAKNESLNFEFKYNDRSTKLTSILGGNLQLESTAYPDINLGISFKYLSSQDRVDTRVDYVLSPFETDERKKLNFQFVFSYFKSFNGLKLNTFVEIKKQITDVNIKVGLSHQNTPTSSNTVALVRYAKEKDIIVKLDTYSPQGIGFHYEVKLNTTLPAVQQPMIAHVRIIERKENEYDLDFSGTWFSGHTAMAKGIFQDKSNYYATNYFLKMLVKSRLFSEVVLSVKLTTNGQEHKITISADHENTRYAFMLTHVSNAADVHETYAEYVYNQSAVYFLNNRLNIPKKEVFLELHLDKQRDIHIAAKGMLQRWNSDVGVEMKWDVNRDPSQKILVNFNTRTAAFLDRSRYTAKFSFEYPGHASVASFLLQNTGNYRSLSLAMEMNPSSIIELTAYSENELFTKGFASLGFRLLTPFDNWQESSFFYGLYIEKQSFKTNGSLVWQGDQNVTFDTHGGYLFETEITSLTLSSSLNSSLQDLSALAFGVNYTKIPNEIHLSFLLQLLGGSLLGKVRNYILDIALSLPNVKYSLFVATSGIIKYYGSATEYLFELRTRTPFLEYARTKFNGRLKLMTENRINGDLTFYLNDDLFAIFIKGILNVFEKTKLCLHVLTPYEKYKDISGLLSYDPAQKHASLNLTSNHFNVKADIVYVYNNLSNFHLRLEVISPLNYLKNLILVGMYNGEALDARIGWNEFNVGFDGITHFASWSDLEYGVQLYTPIKNFQQSNIRFKILLEPELKIITARVILSNFTKAGINFEYNSDRSKITYQDQCDNYYDKDTPGIYKSVVLYNGRLELDTLIYPTIIGQYYVQQRGNRYTVDGKIAVFFLQLSLWDQLDYESNFSFNNTFRMISSINMLSEVNAKIDMKNISVDVTNASVDVELISFNKTLNGGVDVFYEHKSTDTFAKTAKTKLNGIHNLAIKMNTPFELVEHGQIRAITRIENYNFDTEIEMVTTHTNISFTGNVQYLNNFFDLNALFNMTSDFTMVPAFKLQILRDFSKLEKQIIFSLKEPNPKNNVFADIFSLRSMWYIDDRNYITLMGELKSPFKILDELKASLHYSHQIETETYYLEAYMKYSNKTEMKARANLNPPNVTLNLETSMEGLRNAHFVGTLERTSAGHQKIDAAMLTNSNFRIQGSSSITDMMPFAIKGRLIKGKEGIELSSVEMHVKKKSGGYIVLAALNSKGKTLHVETEITDYPSNTRIINLAIKTGKGVVESLQVNAELKLQHPGLYILTVNANSAVETVTGSSVTKVEVLFRDGIGAIFASLNSTALKGKAEIVTVWKPPYNYYGSSKINFILEKKLTELLNAKIYFSKLTGLVSTLSTGVMVNLNSKWTMEANLTAWSSTNDKILLTHLLLPNNNKYSLTGGFNYSNNFDEFQHVIAYSTSYDIPCFTHSNINLVTEDVRGMFAFKCGSKGPLFLVDKFNGKKTPNKLVLSNFLRSNTLTDILTTNVIYGKSNNYHVIDLKFYYPPTKLIAIADVNFQSTNNFDCFVNTTTPYAYMPHFACEIKSKTDSILYHRLVKVYLHKRPAVVNLTHIQTMGRRSILNDGTIYVTFPVATWHKGVMNYTYEDTFSKIVGSSKIFYNDDQIIHANFTRNATRATSYDKYFTHLAVGNTFMPVGINYIRQTSKGSVILPVYDLKRFEVFKLLNPDSLNVTTELLLEEFDFQKWTTIKVLNFNRSFLIKSRTDTGNPYETNSVSLKLKPELWFDYDLQTNRTVTNSAYKKVYDLKIAYPRRNFSLVGDFGFGDNYLAFEVMVRNFLTEPHTMMGLIFHSEKPFYNLRETIVILFHPSFQKNVTLLTNFHSTSTKLADLKMELEYSNDVSRKLELSGVIEDKSAKGNRNYTLHLNGKHPATKFKLDVSGALTSETGIHFVGNNITYKRSYLPDQYWNGKAVINTKDSVIEIERHSTRALILIYGDYKKKQSNHIVNTKIVEGISTDISGHCEFDFYNKIANAIVNLTKDSSDRLEIVGVVRENRAAQFNIWRTYNDFLFPQMTFYLTLNHSRFLSSALLWRTDIGTNILKTVRSSISYMWVSAQESVDFWTQFLRSEASETLTAVWNDAKPEISEFLDDFGKIKTIQENINYFKGVLNDSYNANEFFLRDLHDFYKIMSQEMSFVDKIGSLPKIVNELVEAMGETGTVIKKSFVWVVNTIKELYEELLRVLDELVEGKAEMYVARFIKKGTEKFDNFIKDLHISFVSSTEIAMNEFISVLTHYRIKIMSIFEPTFVELIHHLDTTFWASARKLVDFIYAKKDDLINSPYFLRNANFTQRLDAIYKDFTKNDLITNIKKYVGVIFNAVYDYYVSKIPYREELASIGSEIIDEIKQLNKLPFIAYTVENIRLMYNQAVFLFEYFEVSSKVQKLIPFLYRQFQENSSTALEIQMKSQKPKTKFVFVPENGIIKLEQKLPFPWHAFNETPIYEELEEYKYWKKVQSFISNSKLRIWSFYRILITFFNPKAWFPPYEGYAQILGFHNFITYDSVHVPFKGNYCKYLLSHDFVNDEFSLILNSDEHQSRTEQSISLLIDGETITIKFEPLKIRVDSKKMSKFPLQLNSTYIYFDHNIVTVIGKNGVTLECNVYYKICAVRLSGWFYGKVSGLLGTMNNEHSDDVQSFSHYFHKKEYYLWSLSQERGTCPATTTTSMMPPDYGVNEKCNVLFQNTTSPLESCFSEVDPAPYYDVCITSLEEKHVCSAAMAYVQSCFTNSVPIRIPTFCASCSMGNNKYDFEGSFHHLEGKLVPQSSDVVFIVEAKSCNQELLSKKSVQQLISGLSKELTSSGYTGNRYALVVFGGDDIFGSPHSVVIQGHVFSNSTSFGKYFERFPAGNGNVDIFDAIRFATKLSFRIGVSKTFILMPCSNCNPRNMTLDYSVLHHALTEKSIRLHILMNEEFPVDKSKSGKMLFGVDMSTAYTKEDFEKLKGDVELYKQTKLTKSLLGYCTPLALETNGTLFTSRFLSGPANMATKFISVFAKRVALTAKPDECQECECHSDKNGVPYVDCITCSIPTPVNFDFENDDETDFPALLSLESQSSRNTEL